MFGRRVQDRAAGTAARGAGRAVRGAGKVAGGTGKLLLRRGPHGRAARKAARGAGKVTLKGGRRVLSPGESTGSRFLKYGFFAVVGFAAGSLVARLGREREVSSSFTGETGRPAPGSPAGQRGEPWGSGTPLGTAGGSTDIGTVPSEHQRPGDPQRTGAEREYSDPSSGPLIGRRHRGRIGDVPEQQEEVEQRIRTRIGEDPRTLNLPRINVEVNDGVAELRGPAPSEDVKEAAGEIAASVEGVEEVRNLLTVDPESPTRTDKAAGDETEPEQPT